MSVIVVGGLDAYLKEVVAGLVRRRVPVTCLLDRYASRNRAEPLFADTEVIDARRFVYPEFVRKLNADSGKLSQELVERFYKAESVFLSNSDRYSHHLSVAERKALYYELLQYFYGWLSTGHYRVVVFPNVPHAGWNNVLYFVAKQLGLATIILEPTRLNDRVVLWDDYERVNKVPAEYLADASAEEMRQTLDPALARELLVDSTWMVVSDEINEQSLQQPSDLRLVLDFLRRQLRGVWRGRSPRISAPAETDFDRVWLLNAPLSPGYEAWLRYTHKRHLRRLFAYYEAHTAAIDTTTPYVLFFLNYQPEKTTTPMGGVFENQLLAVRALTAALPQGWQLLVKEHPRQFGGSLDSWSFRSQSFYDDLLRLPRVRLVSQRESTSRLITAAQCTATITGSIGWQGLLQHKPCLVFGSVWYAACPSCFVVRSAADCQRALADIQASSARDVERHVLRYLHFAQNQFIIGGNGDRYVARSRRSGPELADSLAAALAERINQVLRNEPVVADVQAPQPLPV